MTNLIQDARAAIRGCNRWRSLVLLCLLGLPILPTGAQDLPSGPPPWSAYPAAPPQYPVPAESEAWGSRPPAGPSFAPYQSQQSPGFDPRTNAFGGAPAPSTRNPNLDDYQPDLTGSWKGSGGESVEIRGNRARIWGGRHLSCDCVFFLVGDRLIAYSPDTDVIRKFHFRGDHERFWLIDDEGHLMSFWRVR